MPESAGVEDGGFEGQLAAANSLEFEGIETTVVDALPDSKEEDGAFVLEPLLDEGSSSIEVPHHVSE